jgi:hypothetical protein
MLAAAVLAEALEPAGFTHVEDNVLVAGAIGFRRRAAHHLDGARFRIRESEDHIIARHAESPSPIDAAQQRPLPNQHNAACSNWMPKYF